jgi:hypothetical protein
MLLCPSGITPGEKNYKLQAVSRAAISLFLVVCSSHLERILIGENVDIDILPLFPQEYARIMGRIKNYGKL